LLSVAETARYLGISPRTIYNGIGRKAERPFPVKPVRVGGAIRFDLLDLENFVDARKAA